MGLPCLLYTSEMLLQIEERRRREVKKCKHENEQASMPSLEESITNAVKQIVMEFDHLVKEIVHKARPLTNAEEDPKKSYILFLLSTSLFLN